MADRPNIILIITDQQRYDSINALGFPWVDTPNLDRLVQDGTSFDNCFITAPSCAPARASLFTGYWPHVTGVLQNADLWRHSWVERMADAGYHCVNIGKMHSFPYETPLGFHERYVVENKDRYLEGRYYFDEWDKALRARGEVKQQRELYRQWPDYHESLGAFDWKLPADLHPDIFVGDMARWWLESYPQTQPLFLQVGFPGPHPPYDPLPEYAQPYLERELPLQEVRQDDLDGQPSPLKQLRKHNFATDHDAVVHLPEPTQAQRHRQRAYYLANVTMIDEKIGQLMQTLDEQGYLENSIVIFTSDHGDCLTDHGHSQKWTMYDTIMRVPLIVWAPGRVDAGLRILGMCQVDGCRAHGARTGRRCAADGHAGGIAGARPVRRDPAGLESARPGVRRTSCGRDLRRALHDHGAQPPLEAGALPRFRRRPNSSTCKMTRMNSTICGMSRQSLHVNAYC